MLAGLGLADVTQERPVENLSGGQKTRLGLARLLLIQPDLLLLDEPTNHLDIAALAWLEEYLQSYPGAVLVISHDRAFLDRTVNRVLELDDKTHRLREYAGNYTDYAVAVDRALDRRWAAYREQQVRIRDLQSSIRGAKWPGAKYREGDHPLLLAQDCQRPGAAVGSAEAPAGANAGQRGSG